MKRNHRRRRTILSLLLCAVLLSGSVSMTAAEELSVATPTDLAVEEEKTTMALMDMLKERHKEYRLKHSRNIYNYRRSSKRNQAE